jgi:hypothetical protein
MPKTELIYLYKSEQELCNEFVRVDGQFSRQHSIYSITFY